MFIVNNKNGRLVFDLDSKKNQKYKNPNKRKKRAISLLFASSLLVSSLAGCGATKAEGKTTVTISSLDTISDTLKAIAPVSTLDEFLDEKTFVSASTGEESTFEELNEYYIQARQSEDLSATNDALYKLGRMILMAQVAEGTGLDAKDIVSFSFNGSDHTNSNDRCATIVYKVKTTEEASAGITFEREDEREISVKLKGEFANAAINLGRACDHRLVFESDGWPNLDVDDVYRSLVELLLVSSEITVEESGIFNKETTYILKGNLDEEKVAVFKR